MTHTTFRAITMALTIGLLLVTTSTGQAQEQDDRIQRLQSDLAPVLELSDSSLCALIPHRAGLRFVGCPNCTGGTQENQLWWSIEQPGEVYCRHCDLRYPNEQYPDTSVLQVANALGEVQEYPYWDDADGYHHFFQAKGWYVAKLYFEDAALKLAQLYQATGDRDYARRAAVILQRFAEVYPGYLVHYDFPFRQKILWSGEDDFPYPVPDFRAAKWSWWAYMDISEDLLKAYELIQPASVMDEASVRQVEDELFHAMVGFIDNYPPALTNMDPTLLRALITAGRVLHEPAYMHDAVRRIELLVRQQFFGDGVWREGAMSYHNQTVNGLEQLVQLLQGYSDPQDYVPVEGQTRFDNLDLAQQLPILERARHVPELLRYPNGRVVAFHDTWAREQRASTQATGSMLLPELGHARLGRGTGKQQMQAHLHFSGGYGHEHMDVLSLTLFGRGQERLSDIGYTHTRQRAWTVTTLSHNTVTVDGQDQQSGSLKAPSDGALQLFVPGDDLLSLVEASGERAYPQRVQQYRRLLALIGAGDDGYVVDIFRVLGGSRHEYVLVGDADHDGALLHDLPTTRFGDRLLPADVEVNWPTGESTPGDAQGHNLGYAFIGNVEQIDTQAPWTVTFTSQAPDAGAVTVHGAPLSATDSLFAAEAPSIRRAQEDDDALSQYHMPVLVHRRSAAAGDLSSTFATVLENHGITPDGQSARFIDSVERLPVQVSGGEGSAIRIRWGNVTDIVLVGSQAGTSIEAGGVLMQGRFGFVRLRNDVVEHMRLAGGTMLQAGGQTLTGAGVLRGQVAATRRTDLGHAFNGLVTDLDLSQIDNAGANGGGVNGVWAVVIDGAGFHHGHQITGILAEPSATVVVLAQDPGYDIDADGGRQVWFPGRSWTEPSHVEISTLASWSLEQAPR